MSVPTTAVLKVFFICKGCKTRTENYTKRPDIKRSYCERCAMLRGRELSKCKKRK